MTAAFEHWQHIAAGVLVHFLWQGLVIAAVAEAAFRLARNASANARYAIGVGGMIAIVVAPLATTAVLLSRDASAVPEASIAQSTAGRASAPTPAAIEIAVEPNQAIVASDTPTSRPPTMGRVDAIRSTDIPSTYHESWIVAGWSVGVLLLGCRLFLGFVGLYRWSWPRTELPGELRAVVDRLTIALRMSRARVFLNPRVPEALALGVLRPVVLVPTLWATGLPVSMLEAILAHELAHVRRHDLLVNLVQRLVETFLFYHPAVWWLSARVRQERELCCDALAVEVTGDRLIYAQTLEHVARLEATSASWGWAVGIGGRRMHLLQRVQKVLGTPPSQRDRSWPAGLLAIVAVVVMGCLTFLSRPETSAQQQSDEGTGIVVDAQGAPAKGMRIRVFEDSELVRELTADDAGRFRFPRSWRSDARGIALIARDGERLGWNMPSQPRAGKDGKIPEIRIVLFPVNRRVEGVLHDEKGGPISEARLVVDRLSHETNGDLIGVYAGSALDFLAGKTDKTGRFQTVEPRGWIELQVRRSDLAGVRMFLVEGKNDLGTITAPPGGRVTGRLSDAATGAPIRAARVGAQLVSQHRLIFDTGGWGEARSDETGRYEISGLLPGQYNVLFIGVLKNPKLVSPGREGVKVEAGKAAAADFAVREGRRLSGSVVDVATGKPLVNWSVGYYGADRPQSGAACRMVKTDAKGNFEFFVSPGPSRVYVAQGNYVGLGETRRTVEVPNDRDLGNIVLQASTKTDEELGMRIKTVTISREEQAKRDENQDFRLRIELRAPEGRTVNSVVYHWIRNRRTELGSGTFSGKSFAGDAWGNMGRGPYSLVIDADGFAPIHTDEFEYTRRMEPLVIDLRPAVSVPVRGRVFDPDGKPLAGACVRAGRVIALESSTYPWGIESITDASGNYELKGLRQGERLYVYAEKEALGGVKSKRFLLEKTSPMTLPDLRIPAADQTISGRVMSSDGEPIAGAEVTVTGAFDRKGDEKTAKTDANGHFEVKGLMSGQVSLEAKAPGHRMTFPHRSETGANKVEIYLYTDRKAPEVSLKFETSDGSVVGDAAYWWIEVGKGELSSSNLQGNTPTLSFHEHGRRDPKKALVLAIAPRGYAWPKPALVKPAELAKPVIVALEPAAPVALTGRVVNDDGKPLAGVTVGLSLVLLDDIVHESWRYSWGGRRDKETVVTDADGRFRIATFQSPNGDIGLLPGSTVAVYVNKPGFAGVMSKRVTLAKGNDTTVGDIPLPVAKRTIAGTVVDADGKGVGGASVKVRNFGDVGTKTGKDGTFRLEAVPDGPLNLVVDADSYPLEYERVGTDQKEVRVRLHGVEQ